MSGAGPKRPARRSALAGLASFFRQLSLFDPPVSEPASPAGTAAAAVIMRPPSPQPMPPRAVDSPAFAEMCRGPYAHVRVIVKKRLMESWRVTWVRRDEGLRLEIPALLEEAPRAVKESLLEWALLAARRRRYPAAPDLRARRVRLEALIREHLRAPVLGEAADTDAGARSGTTLTSAARKRLERNRKRIERLEPKGVHHDLEAVFAAVNARYFQGGLQARLTWSGRLGGLSTHSLAQDGEGRTYHLLSISRGYDNAEVTPEILGGVVYHECLHIAIPPRQEGGRRVVHGPDFRKREREYEHFEAWRRWHRDGLPKAIRRLARQGRDRS
jgi:hypothetical protein